MVQKLLRSAVVGHIAAPLARDQDLLTGLVGMLQHRYLMPLPHSGPAAISPAAPAPTINTFAILVPPAIHCLSKFVLVYHTRIGPQLQSAFLWKGTEKRQTVVSAAWGHCISFAGSR